MNKQSRLAPVAGPVTPLAGPATPFAGDPENFIELGYGTGPRCIQCRRNVSMCLCNAPEPEAEYFRPGGYFDPDSGWALAEKSAYGMGGGK